MADPRSARVLLLILATAGVVMAGLAWNAAANPRIIIEWTTASELNTAGFNLYRQDGPNAEAVRINETLIPSASDPLQGGDYLYRDARVEAGRTYTYTLEEVEATGGRIDHGTTVARAPRGGILEGVTAGLLLSAAAALAWRQRRVGAGAAS